MFFEKETFITTLMASHKDRGVVYPYMQGNSSSKLIFDDRPQKASRQGAVAERTKRVERPEAIRDASRNRKSPPRLI